MLCQHSLLPFFFSFFFHFLYVINFQFCLFSLKKFNQFWCAITNSSNLVAHMIAAISLNVGLQRPFIFIISYFVFSWKIFKCAYGLNKQKLSVCLSSPSSKDYNKRQKHVLLLIGWGMSELYNDNVTLVFMIIIDSWLCWPQSKALSLQCGK